MSWQTAVTLLGIFFSFLGLITYVRSIIRGRTKPHRVTFGGWLLIGLLGLSSSHNGQAGVGLLVTASFVVGLAIIFALSLNPKYGKPGGTKLDYIIGAIAAIMLLSNLFVDYSPAVGATIAVIGDAIFTWPTLREAWRHPELEAVNPWVAGLIAELLGIIALENYSYGAAAYSVYILLADLLVVVALILSPKIGPARKSQSKTGR